MKKSLLVVAMGLQAAVVFAQSSLAIFGYVYQLSRRTAIYTSTAWLGNKGGDTFTFRGGHGGTSGLLGGGSGTGYDIGIRHSF